MKNNVRIVWLDNLKSFAIFFLFWGHCCGCLTPDLNLFFIAWHMPLFVFASGYTSVGLRDKIKSWSDVDSYTEKIAMRLGLPNLLFSMIAMATVYGLQLRWSRMSLALCVTIFLLILGWLFYTNKLKDNNWIKYGIVLICFFIKPIWYLPFLMETLLIFAIIQCITYKYFKNNTYFFMSMFLFTMLIVPSPFHATAEFVVIFLCALIANYKNNSIKRLFAKIQFKGIFLLCIFMFIIGWCSFKGYESYEHQFYLSWWLYLIKEGDYLTFLLRQISILMFVPVIVLIIIFFSNKYNTFSRYGTLTLGLYSLNVIFVEVYKKMFISLGIILDNSNPGYVLLYMVFVLLTSLLFVEFLNSFNYTRFCFLGSRK